MFRNFLILASPMLALSFVGNAAADGNRLTYLDSGDPYYVSRDFAKLTTPQWIGEEGVEAVVVLAIDDMREAAKYENYLRPILQRLKKIDGRAGVSIMTNRIDPEDPQLKQWLDEGLSIEIHTYDHPCPLLKDNDFAKARSTYERCVDLIHRISGNRPVAYRMPCCDSLNTVSPRFFSEIFNKTTEQGNFLSIDTSVFHVFTADDPDVGDDAGFDADGTEKFRKYVPYDRSFVNTIENYPYPYVINRLCWEFSCVTPSDWSAQHLHKPDNPITIADWKTAIDLAVKKQGTFNLVFHPHGWIRNDQVVELIDHAVTKHGKKVKFLSFREAQERINQNLLGGHPLRTEEGGDNGVRLIDVNADGYMDVVIANEKVRQTRVWLPRDNSWQVTDFPQPLVVTGSKFGLLTRSGNACAIFRNKKTGGGWVFDGKGWRTDDRLLDGLEIDGQPVLTSRDGKDDGVRLRDLDGDGICEAIVASPHQRGVFRYDLRRRRWKQLSFNLPEGTAIVRASGNDAGLRFVDIDEDGFDDVIFSDESRYSLHLFRGMKTGWSEQVLSGKQGDDGAIPMIVRGETDNGAWFHSRHLWVQNEDTAKMPNLVDRRSYDDLLKEVFPGPKSPEMSLRSMQPRAGFTVELVAAEPLVMDPVAFEWGADGKLWVAEMADYPLGMDGKGKFGGRIRYLEDTDDDGRYDKSTLFLDGIGYPSGVTPWGKGVLVTAAPEIFYAEDTDGDGRADKRRTLYQGFHEGNQQHRVNGFTYGLDNWWHCANGDSGGTVKSLKTGKQISLKGSDLRIHPPSGGLDTLAGRTQFGRNRDAWGNWFGNSNSQPMFHFVLNDRYTRRNPHVAPPNATVQVSIDPGTSPVYPISRTLPRFNDFDKANRFTSACGAMIYDDEFFGPEFVGNSFVSEPVHNLVHREIVSPDGLTFTSRRADDEQQSEFLASSDNWFRPAMIKAGPDGALWVADMYRRVIEHPEWVPDDWEARLDVRAGDDRGRIYRVYLRGKTPRRVPRLSGLSTPKLVAALDSSNRWQRDTTQRLLVERRDQDAVTDLQRLAKECPRPAARLHALCTLEGIGKLSSQILVTGLRDAHPAVRRHAARLCEPFFDRTPQLGAALLELTGDADPQVLLQVAFSLGQWNDPRAGVALGKLAARPDADRYLIAAVMSSVSAKNIAAVLTTVLKADAAHVRTRNVFSQLLTLAAALEDRPALRTLFAAVSQSQGGNFAEWQFAALAAALDTFDRRGTSLNKLRGADRQLDAALDRLNRLFAAARKIAVDEKATEGLRRDAMRLLGRSASGGETDVEILLSLLTPQNSAEIQSVAVTGLTRMGMAEIPSLLLDGWRGYGPQLRGQVVDALLQNESRTVALLDAVEDGRVKPPEIDAARRQRLTTFRAKPIRERAKKLLADTVNADRQAVVQRYQKALSEKGNPQLGKQVFAKICANCHRLQDVGTVVGPDLAALSDKSTPTLLTALFDPNRAVESKYLNYTAVTNRGLSFSGILAEQTGNSITLLAAEGKKQVILRADLDELISTSKSMMPEGMEKDLKPDDVRHLIAFLQSTRPPLQRRSFPGNGPGVARASFDGTISLQARKCEVYGESLVYESTYHNLGFWKSETDHAVWQVEIPHDGTYNVLMEWACPTDNAGNSYAVITEGGSLTGKVTGTGSWDDYEQKSIGQLKLRAGRGRITVRSKGPINGHLFDLRSLTLMPIKAHNVK